LDVSLLITNCSVFESEAAAAVPRNGDHYSSSHEYRSTNAFVSTYYVHGTCETFQTSDVDTAKIYPLQLSLDPPSSIITGSIARSANLPVFRLLRGRF